MNDVHAPVIRVALVTEENPAWAQWLQNGLLAPDIVVVGRLRSGPLAEAEATALCPDILLLEADHLCAATVALLAQFPTLVICHRECETEGLQALLGGAAGLLILDETTPETLADAVRAVRHGEAILSPRITGQVLDTLTHYSITEKENQP